MAFVHYRASTIGIQLEETLKELLSENVIDTDLVEVIKKEFDKTVATVLKKKVKDRPGMRGKLKHYQNCDGAWMFYVTDPEIRVSNYSLPVPINGPLKIIACESKILTMKFKKKTTKIK
jgi:transcription initiation factor TFIIA small subunit